MVAADDQTAVTFSLFPGQPGDAPEGRKLSETLKDCGWEGTQAIMYIFDIYRRIARR